jgi:uncharacterized SAM-binding protein YcdF (DUF218 family)
MITLAKLIGFAFYPLSLSLIALALALVLWRRRPKDARALVVFATTWLWLWSTPWIAERAAWTLERDYPPVAIASLPTADAIVVLGGLLEASQPPFAPDPDLNSAADRAWFAARLWRAGKAPRVICTGGVAPLSRAAGAECPDMARLLRDFGVPAEAITIEASSRTTHENAEETARLLHSGARILLVTSARHMPRSYDVFASFGMRVIPAPTDHAWRPDRPFSLGALLPSPSALALSTSTWHEWIGRLWYVIATD